jgi:MinD-like ATPase involved in chromosome partitioning or flagellar assembly/CheY-like chemotaxis protein
MDPIKVLIIDSDDASRIFLAQILTKKNYTVFHTKNFAEGIEMAIQARPSLIVVDTGNPNYSPSDFMNSMGSNPVLASIPCVAISNRSDADEMQVCIAAGFSEYFVKSGMAMVTLGDSIPKILVSGRKQVDAKKDGLLFVFLSAKGGTGTSSLCANIGMNIAQHIGQSKVAVIDLVLPIGSIANITGQENGMNIATVTDRPVENITPDYVRENLVSPPHWLIHLLPGSPSPHIANQLHVERIPNVIDALRKTHDYVLVDIGRALSRISLPIIKQADLIALVLGTDASTVALTKTVLDFLQQEEEIQASRIYPILNRAVGTEGLTKVDAERELGIGIRLMMPYLMGNFTMANNQHVPLTQKFPTDTAATILKEAAIEMSRQAIKSSGA